MLARVADRIYWMSRQMERAENMARILGVTSNMVLFGAPETRQQNLLAPLTITDSAERYFEKKKSVKKRKNKSDSRRKSDCGKKLRRPEKPPRYAERRNVRRK